MITRRGLLAGIFATATAPAIVKADSLMKIFVPSKKIIVGRGLTSQINIIDEASFMSEEFINFSTKHHLKAWKPTDTYSETFNVTRGIPDTNPAKWSQAYVAFLKEEQVNPSSFSVNDFVRDDHRRHPLERI
jgi:hypothetical protein